MGLDNIDRRTLLKCAGDQPAWPEMTAANAAAGTSCARLGREQSYVPDSSRSQALTDERFAPSGARSRRAAADFRAPTLPFNDHWDSTSRRIANAIGFTVRQQLCFARMMVDGFLDAFPKLDLIACHGRGALPYLAARHRPVLGQDDPRQACEGAAQRLSEAAALRSSTISRRSRRW